MTEVLIYGVSVTITVLSVTSKWFLDNFSLIPPDEAK